MQRDKLAVQIALGDGVAVDKGERADACTHERLRRVRADAADAEHRDVRRPQLCKIFLADERDLARVCLPFAHVCASALFVYYTTRAKKWQGEAGEVTKQKNFSILAKNFQIPIEKGANVYYNGREAGFITPKFQRLPASKEGTVP